MFGQMLVDGAVGATVLVVVAFLLSRFTRDVVGRGLLAAVLVGAAAMYILFAVRAGEPAFWVVGEIVGVAIYGTMGALGVRGSYWWLVAGWALHPIWDMGLHYAGPGGSFTPMAYAVSCLSWDLLVAAYVAVAYGFGLVGARRRMAPAAA